MPGSGSGERVPSTGPDAEPSARRQVGPDPQPIRPTLTLADLTRWEDNGATWRALEITDRHAVVELCTCYGEAVDVVRGDASELIEFVRARRAGPEPG